MTKIDFSQAISAEARAAAALAEARDAGLREVVGMIEAATEALTGAVPMAERLVWSAKEEAAQAVVEGRADAVTRALIEAEAHVTGEAPDLLAARVLRKAQGYREALALMSGLRRKAAAEIAAAGDAAEVEAALAALRVGLMQKSDDLAASAPARSEGIEPEAEAML